MINKGFTHYFAVAGVLRAIRNRPYCSRNKRLIFIENHSRLRNSLKNLLKEHCQAHLYSINVRVNNGFPRLFSNDYLRHLFGRKIFLCQ